MKSWDIDLSIQVRAENFSLLISAVQSATLATVIPTLAVSELSKEMFAVIEMEGMESLNRSLALIHSPDGANLRQIIRRLSPRMASILYSGK